MVKKYMTKTFSTTTFVVITLSFALMAFVLMAGTVLADHCSNDPDYEIHLGGGIVDIDGGQGLCVTTGNVSLHGDNDGTPGTGTLTVIAGEGITTVSDDTVGRGSLFPVRSN